MNTKLVLTAFVFASVVGVKAGAAAQPIGAAPADPRLVSVTVTTEDLNLRTEAGAAELMKRIRAAASVACAGAPRVRSPAGGTFYNACVTDAVNRASLSAVVAANRPDTRITVLARATR